MSWLKWPSCRVYGQYVDPLYFRPYATRLPRLTTTTWPGQYLRGRTRHIRPTITHFSVLSATWRSRTWRQLEGRDRDPPDKTYFAGCALLSAPNSTTSIENDSSSLALDQIYPMTQILRVWETLASAAFAPEYARDDPWQQSMQTELETLTVAGISVEGRWFRDEFTCTTKGTSSTIFPALKSSKSIS